MDFIVTFPHMCASSLTPFKKYILIEVSQSGSIALIIF